MCCDRREPDVTGTEQLSFRVRVARTEADMQAACRVRASSYGRRAPELGSALALPDNIDHAAGVCVMVATDKRSGAPIGTIRVQHSHFGALLIESSAQLPAPVGSHSRAEFTRFAIEPGSDPLVRSALFKAAFMFSRASQVRHIVIGARSRALIRIYESLGFSRLNDGAMVPLLHAGNIPHMLLANDMSDIENRWRAAGHQWLGFMVDTFHPDIDLFSGRPALASSEPAARELALAA